MCGCLYVCLWVCGCLCVLDIKQDILKYFFLQKIVVKNYHFPGCLGSVSNKLAFTIHYG